MSRNEFSRVETRRVERHFFRKNGNREKMRLLKLAKMKIAKKHVFSQFFQDFLQSFAKIRVGMSILQFSRVWKGQTLPKYFRNLKKVNFRNLQKQKNWKKTV